MTDTIDDLKYDCKLNISYHRKREIFYRGLDATSKAVSLIALACIGVDANPITIGVAVVSSLFTIATIVSDYAGMAGRHAALAAQFTTLLSKIVVSSENGVHDLRSEYYLLETTEPPQLRGLVQLCQDEQDAADGEKVDAMRLSLRRKIAAQFGFGWLPIEQPAEPNA